MVLTADHGHQFDPNVTGAYPINPQAFISAVNQHFGADVVREVRPTQVWLNKQALSQAGTTPASVADYIMTMTKSQVPTGDVDTPSSELGEKLFEAAFPTSTMKHAPCLPKDMDQETASQSKGQITSPKS